MQELSRPEFEELFERGVTQANRILRDRAASEDVAAEAMGRLIMDGKGRKHFKLIVHGLTVDAYRRLQKELPVMYAPESDDGVDGAMSLVELEEGGLDVLWQGAPLTVEQVEFRADFDQAVRSIPIELDRQAFLLTTVRGLSYVEAAHILDMSDKSVRHHAERARAQIKEAIA